MTVERGIGRADEHPEHRDKPVIDGAAAFAVGAVFAAWGLPMAARFVLAEATPDWPLAYWTIGPVMLAVVVALTAALARVRGWLVAAVGLGVALAGTQIQVIGGEGALAYRPVLANLLAQPLVGAGIGFAVGGAMLAAAHGAARTRIVIAGGLTAGMLLGPLTAHLAVRSVAAQHPVISSGTPQVAVAALIVIAAAVLTRGRGASPAVARPVLAPALVVVVAAAVTVGGTVLRALVIRQVRLSPDGLASPRRQEAVELFGHYSLIAIAVVTGLILTGYAYRSGRAAAARWVALGFAAAGVAVGGLSVDFAYRPVAAVVTAAVALLASITGVALARYAGRVLPWDAVGICVAAGGLMFGAEVVRRQFDWAVPAYSVLVGGGLGLAFGSGLALALLRTTAPSPAAPPPDPARLAGALGLGFAALMLVGQTLAPITMAARMPQAQLPVTIPVISMAGAAVLLLLFGWGRAVERIRRELREEAGASPAKPES